MIKQKLPQATEYYEDHLKYFVGLKVKLQQDKMDRPSLYLADLINNVEKTIERYERWVTQSKCPHENTTGLQYVGHDSHNDHYENHCKDCGFEVDHNYG